MGYPGYESNPSGPNATQEARGYIRDLRATTRIKGLPSKGHGRVAFNQLIDMNPITEGGFYLMIININQGKG